MDSKKVITVIKDYAVMTVGALVFCFSWDAFLIPADVVSGGLTGLCTVIQFATDGMIPVSWSYIVINVILLGVGFLVLGKGFGFRTIYCIAVSSIFFALLPKLDFIQCLPGHPMYLSEKVLVPIIGGLIEALGISWIFYKGGSTGGTDVIALMLNKFWPVSPGRVYLVLDIFIITSVLLLPGRTFQDVVYGYMAMVTFSLTIDYLLLGRKSTVQLFIFSSKYHEIADYIIHEMDRGVTVLKGMGWYSQNDRDVLLVLVRKSQLQEVTRMVKAADNKAFMSISPVSSVYGEGFEEIKSGPGGGKRKSKFIRTIHL